MRCGVKKREKKAYLQHSEGHGVISGRPTIGWREASNSCDSCCSHCPGTRDLRGEKIRVCCFAVWELSHSTVWERFFNSCKTFRKTFRKASLNQITEVATVGTFKELYFLEYHYSQSIQDFKVEILVREAGYLRISITELLLKECWPKWIILTPRTPREHYQPDITWHLLQDDGCI